MSKRLGFRLVLGARRATSNAGKQQCRKRVESWWLWIAADIVYVPLYAYKDLYLTSLLYVGFLMLCLAGLRNWNRDLTPDRRRVEAVA